MTVILILQFHRFVFCTKLKFTILLEGELALYHYQYILLENGLRNNNIVQGIVNFLNNLSFSKICFYGKFKYN